MARHVAEELVRVVNDTAARLAEMNDSAASVRGTPDEWSIKEILGHLVDSAVNNHQRFVGAQDGAEFVFPAYEQDAWVRRQDYQARPWPELIELWRIYNHHLAHVIRRIPDGALGVTCRIGEYEPVTLGYLVEDYLTHMRHHVKEIEKRAAAASP